MYMHIYQIAIIHRKKYLQYHNYNLGINVIVCDYRATANNQQTINPLKMEKCLLWDPDQSPLSPSRTYAFTSVASGCCTGLHCIMYAYWECYRFCMFVCMFF